VSFQVRPELEEHLDALCEKDDLVEGNAEVCGVLASHCGDEDHQDHSDAGNHQIERETEPSLDRVHHVEWSLGKLEQLEVLLFHVSLPAEGTN
jgi:hypothetical protein